MSAADLACKFTTLPGAVRHVAAFGNQDFQKQQRRGQRTDEGHQEVKEKGGENKTETNNRKQKVQGTTRRGMDRRYAQGKPKAPLKEHHSQAGSKEAPEEPSGGSSADGHGRKKGETENNYK